MATSDHSGRRVAQLSYGFRRRGVVGRIGGNLHFPIAAIFARGALANLYLHKIRLPSGTSCLTKVISIL